MAKGITIDTAGTAVGITSLDGGLLDSLGAVYSAFPGHGPVGL